MDVTARCVWLRTNETQDGHHHLVQRHGGPDLVIGRSPQHRLNGLNVATDAGELAGCFAVGVAGSGRQPPHQHLERSAQQDDVVELRMELRLVLLTARDEQNVGVLCGQECLDGVFGRGEAQPMRSASETMIPSGPRT